MSTPPFRPGDLVTPERYGVIVADPNWQFSQYRDSSNGAAASAYECDVLAPMIAINPGRWAADTCVLAMWGCLAKLPEAVDLMRAWGFRYRAGIPWLKTEPAAGTLATGIGIWSQGCCEIMMFGTRGEPGGFYEVTPGRKETNLFGVTETIGRRPRRIRPQVNGVLAGDGAMLDAAFWGTDRKQWPILYERKARAHSRKPGTMQDYLQSFDGPYLELYARRARPGWTSWGLDLGYELGPWGVRPCEPVSNGAVITERTTGGPSDV